MGCADGLFRPVVEVVAEGRSDLAFQFDSRDQFTLVDDQQIPEFGWPKETGQRQDGAFLMDVGMGESIGSNDICLLYTSPSPRD